MSSYPFVYTTLGKHGWRRGGGGMPLEKLEPTHPGPRQVPRTTFR